MSNGQKSPWRKRIGRKGIRQIEMLAVLAICLLRIDSAQWLPTFRPAWTAYATSVGRAERVTLQDGSCVDLNTDSEIEVRFVGAERQIVLLHGEALFTVVSHPDWPFSVKAGGATIRAVGTKFSVRLREHDEAEVLVIEGRVAIESGRERTLASGAERPTGARRAQTVARVADTAESSPLPVIAPAGELISVSSTSVLSRVELPLATLKRRTAWTAGWIWFAKDPLSQAVAEFNRYHPQRLVLVDPSLARLEIGGRFRSADLDSFIATLRHSFHVRAVSSIVPGTGTTTIYLAGRCGRASQQCNWPMVQ
jgi:transmembrane sensor